MNHDWQFIKQVATVMRTYTGLTVGELADGLQVLVDKSDDVPRTQGAVDDLLDIIGRDEVIYPEDLSPEQLEAVYLAATERQRVIRWAIKIHRAANPNYDRDIHPSRAARR